MAEKAEVGERVIQQAKAAQRAAAVVACSEWRPAHRVKNSAAAADFPSAKDLAGRAEVSIRTVEHAKAAQRAAAVVACSEWAPAHRPEKAAAAAAFSTSKEMAEKAEVTRGAASPPGRAYAPPP